MACFQAILTLQCSAQCHTCKDIIKEEITMKERNGRHLFTNICCGRQGQSYDKTPSRWQGGWSSGSGHQNFLQDSFSKTWFGTSELCKLADPIWKNRGFTVLPYLAWAGNSFVVVELCTENHHFGGLLWAFPGKASCCQCTHN